MELKKTPTIASAALLQITQRLGSPTINASVKLLFRRPPYLTVQSSSNRRGGNIAASLRLNWGASAVCRGIDRQAVAA